MGRIRTQALATAFLLLLAGCAVVEARPAPGRNGMPIVVIVLDELPLATLVDQSGAIDERLFPNFARLQGDSTWFRNATTGATFTHVVMPSILRGARPNERLQNASLLPHNLFTLLAGSHDLHTTQPFPRLCPDPLCKPIPPAPRYEPLRAKYPDFSAGDRGEKVLSLASFMQATVRPRLYFAHFVMPHQPWAYLPSGDRYASASLLPGQFDAPGRGMGWSDRWWLTAQAYQRHILQTQFTDRLIGELIDRMRDEDIYDDSLLVVTADHGIAFEPGMHKRVATASTVGQLAHVPLFVKRPAQRQSRISDRPVELADIVPTIADVVGLPYEWPEVEGRSLFHRKNVTTPPRWVAEVGISQQGRELYDAVGLKYRMFERMGDSIDPFTIRSPSTRHLIGQPISRFGDASSAGRVDIANEGLFGATDRAAPALLHGTLEGDIEDRAVLAVVVDGRIVGVTPAFVEGGRTRFYCMLPPRALARSDRAPQIYEVTTEGLAPFVSS